jgi:hypothetical protein
MHPQIFSIVSPTGSEESVIRAFQGRFGEFMEITRMRPEDVYDNMLGIMTKIVGLLPIRRGVNYAEG